MSKINHAAVIPEKTAQLVYQERPIPAPGDDELLIRNKAIAVNPVDWKIQDWSFFVEKYPNVLGSDVCGIVEAVGPKVTKFKVGDRVAGFAATIYNSDINHGAFQTYPLLREVGTTKIPDSMSFEEASVFPMAMATAAISMFLNLKLPRPAAGQFKSDEAAGKALLIWGGASSLGQCAIQIAKFLGLKSYITASAKHHSRLKDLGAAQTFDYHDDDVEEQIAKTAEADGVPILMGYDTISEKGTLHRAAKALVLASKQNNPGGETPILSYVLWQPEGQKDPKGVQLKLTVAMRHGQDQQELGAWFFNEWLRVALESGELVPVPEIEIFPGGIKATQAAFDKLRPGVSGKKYVIQVDE